jgi:hypothetical protein
VLIPTTTAFPRRRLKLSRACPITEALTPSEHYWLAHDAANNTDSASHVPKAGPARTCLSADSHKTPHTRRTRYQDCVPSGQRQARNQTSYGTGGTLSKYAIISQTNIVSSCIYNRPHVLPQFQHVQLSRCYNAIDQVPQVRICPSRSTTADANCRQK